jgi:hypothetical protein
MEEYETDHKDHDELEGEKDSWKYEKPTLERVEKMNFMFDSLNSLNYLSKSCRQCSSCHGCR